ncbi:MAG: RcpC/CpaB family pilus assembly protein [Motilibacteraceae bacterium]
MRVRGNGSGGGGGAVGVSQREAPGRPAGGAALPAPAARRLPRARWLDARLLVGILLVLVSVVVGARVVAASDKTTGLWAAAHDLAAGTPLTAADLVRVDVVLPKRTAAYLPASRDLSGRVVSRPVGAGELLPAAAVVTAPSDLRRLPVQVDRAGVTGLAAGSAVDLYVVPAKAAGQPQAPTRQVLGGVPVLDVSADSGGLGSQRTAVVVLSLHPADAQRVLDAQAAGDLRLVQVPLGAAPGGGSGAGTGTGSGAGSGSGSGAGSGSGSGTGGGTS